MNELNADELYMEALALIKQNRLREAFPMIEKSAEGGNGNAQYQYGLYFYANEIFPADYAKAKQWFEKSAEKNNSDAMLLLGNIYAQESTEFFDLKQAAYWFENSAILGNISAYHNSAICYLYGYGVEKNYEKALGYLETASKKGQINSQYVLAEYYMGIYDGKTNYEEANKWYKEAADNNEKESCLKYGYNLSCGIGTEKNLEQAVYYYQKAINLGNQQAIVYLIHYYEANYQESYKEKIIELFKHGAKLKNGDVLFEQARLHYLGNIVKKSQRKSDALLKKAAEYGSYDAAYFYAEKLFAEKKYADAAKWYSVGLARNDLNCITKLAYMYINGLGVKLDPKKSIELFEIAALSNDPYAICCVGEISIEEKFGVTDFVKAKKYLEKAIELNYSSAYVFLGQIYELGLGIPKDEGLAFQNYNKGTELECIQALYHLARSYFYGMGTNRSLEKAQELFSKAHKELLEIIKNNEDNTWYYFLGNMYFYGYGVEKNFKMAKKYLLKAHKLNHHDAIDLLKQIK